jgi:DNA replication initiation complex subunit (GINS family)
MDWETCKWLDRQIAAIDERRATLVNIQAKIQVSGLNHREEQTLYRLLSAQVTDAEAQLAKCQSDRAKASQD